MLDEIYQAVRLGDAFYRVDADLPVNSVTSLTPAFAGLEGAGGSRCLWPAIAEKAFAYLRSPSATPAYANLNSGKIIEVYAGFGLSGSRNSLVSDLAGAWALAEILEGYWARGAAIGLHVTRGNDPNPDPNAWLVSSHAYSVVQVNRDSLGYLTSIVVRNPWGIDGRQASGDASDGLITLTLSDLWQIRNRFYLVFSE